MNRAVATSCPPSPITANSVLLGWRSKCFSIAGMIWTSRQEGARLCTLSAPKNQHSHSEEGVARGQNSASSLQHSTGQSGSRPANLRVGRDKNLRAAVGGDPDSAVSQSKDSKRSALLLARCRQREK